MFRQFRYLLAKQRLAFHTGAGQRPASVQVIHQKHQDKVEDFAPNADSYRRLATFWDEFAGWFVPPYGAFLRAACNYYGVRLRAALDLASGTGLLTRQLAQRAETVVGMDLSADMLDSARQRTEEANVRYVHGDFRDFSLEESFDVVLCGSDSINYIEKPEELTKVFACVRRHLKPGGLFVFDTFDEADFRARADMKTIGVVDGQWFEIYTFYDPQIKVTESRAVFGETVERHRRIPIEEADVYRAAQETDLIVAEHFSCNSYRRLNNPLARQFYVLRDPRPGPARPPWWAFWRPCV